MTGSPLAGELLPAWYAPADGYLWDPWFHASGDAIHLFHLLQVAPAGSARTAAFPRDRPVIAHATWTASTGWQPRGVAVDYTGTSYDEQRIHTGCVVDDAGGFAMLYSGSNRFVCLARSDDADRWRKAAENPVLRPDPALYLDSWRDPWLLQSSVGERQTMLVAAQEAGGGSRPVGVVAVAHSPDLLHWQQDRPLRTPPWFEWLEVPELHRLDGVWYLLFATRERWITASGRDALRAYGLEARDGAYYLMASSWRGPYESIGFLSDDLPNAYTTRLLPISSTRCWLWSHVEHDDSGRTVFALEPPRRATVRPGGGLLVDGIEHQPGRRGAPVVRHERDV